MVVQQHRNALPGEQGLRDVPRERVRCNSSLANLPLFLSGRSYLLYFGYGSRFSGIQPAPTGPTRATPHHPAQPSFASYYPC
ncbi:hypothetical protein SKAU_G00093640 [Synaphobranchus kaupii]|uniref:Uncharacterized protein n=1 Tax=Synaphobranchus kaupii TaxID=118154 RepID=A0A9Q1FY39_SYNKA|nr:hypothetical protein SKAU_G00093640 [Synaphobranchus kaupii]